MAIFLFDRSLLGYTKISANDVKEKSLTPCNDQLAFPFRIDEETPCRKNLPVFGKTHMFNPAISI